VFEQEEARRLVGEILYYRGRIHAVRGDLAAAEADLKRAGELLARSKVKILLWCVDWALATLHAAGGQGEKARQDRGRAVGSTMLPWQATARWPAWPGTVATEGWSRQP
jgi:hypothetical protein